MKKIFSNNNSLIIVFVILFISLLFQELVFRCYAFGTILGIEVLRIVLFIIITSLIFTLLFYFCNKRITKILTCLIIFLLGSYTIIQLTFKNLIGNFMSFNMAGEEVGRVSHLIIEFLKAIKLGYLLIYLPVLVLIIWFIFERKIIEKTKLVWYKILILLILILGLDYLSIISLNWKIFQTGDIKQNYNDLYYNPQFPELALKQFGTTRFLVRDVFLLLNPATGDSIDINIPDKNKNNEEEVTDYTRVIDDTVWKEQMSKEKDSTIVQLDNYFINQNITPKNKMTGYFKGKNLILIMVEAFDMIAIDRNLTPTLYNMANEGWYFENHYAPVYSCATGDSEYIGLTSIVPDPTVCVPNAYKNNNYDASLFALFNNSNYYSTSYHNYIDKFYDRAILHKSMGSLHYYDRTELKIPILLGWPSDIDLMQKATPHFINQDKFFTFMTTVSTHFPYDIDSAISKKNWNLVKDIPYNIKIKRYMAKAIELDRSLKYLLDELEKNGKLDNTVIALFGDHHPLRTEFSYINAKSPINRLEGLNIDINPFIIYNSKLESRKIQTVNSTFDILPTIANLFDLNYDPRYYSGKDIFSQDQHIVIFPNGGWVSDLGRYSASQGKFYPNADAQIDPNYATNTSQIVKNEFTIYKQVLRKDYFKYRFGEN